VKLDVIELFSLHLQINNTLIRISILSELSNFRVLKRYSCNDFYFTTV